MTMANPETRTLQQLQRVSLALTDAFFSSVALAAIFQGMFLVLAVEYYKLFGRNEGERMYMRVYVAALLVLSTVYLSLIITIVCQFIEQLIQNNGMLGMRPTLALTIQPWVLSAFCFLTEFFWVYRAVHVSQNRFARVVAAGLWLLAAGAFIAQAATVVQRRLNGDIAMREGTWIYFADTVVCAAILVYELIWKRRQELAVSSPLQQFIALALKTSLIIMVLVAIGAIATTHAFVSGDADSIGVAMAMPNIFPSASCCCIAVSLLQRQSLRASLEGGPSTRGFSNTSRPYPRHNTSLAEALNHISETAAWRGDVVQLSLARHGWEEEDAKDTAVSPPRLPPTVSLPALYKQHTRFNSASRPSRACVGIRETVSTLAMRPCSQVWSRNVSFASSDQTPADLQFAVESITVSVKVEQQVQTENEETPEMEV